MAIQDRPDYPPTPPSPTRSVGDMLRAGLPTAKIQFLSECITGAQVRKTPRGTTAITFLTQNCSPGDVLDPAQAPYVGVVVWIERAIFEGKK